MQQGIAWIGLGRIARHHLDAFAHAPALGEPVAGWDVDADARARAAPLIATADSLEELLVREDVDAVVVSTPTPTHRDVCRTVIEHGRPRMLLVEKPMATEWADVRELARAATSAGIALTCLYHAAYAPEVEWALGHLEDELEGVVGIEAEFADPHPSAAVFGDSWLDSGINALSVIARFVHVERGEVRPVASAPETFEGIFTGRSRAGEVPIRIRTSWHAPEPSKTTRLRLRDGGEVVLDHQAIAVRSGRTAWRSDSPLPRLTQHYLGAFRHALLDRPPDGSDVDLHRLLLESR